jgi:hypothetical protein
MRWKPWHTGAVIGFVVVGALAVGTAGPATSSATRCSNKDFVAAWVAASLQDAQGAFFARIHRYQATAPHEVVARRIIVNAPMPCAQPLLSARTHELRAFADVGQAVSAFAAGNPEKATSRLEAHDREIAFVNAELLRPIH